MIKVKFSAFCNHHICKKNPAKRPKPVFFLPTEQKPHLIFYSLFCGEHDDTYQSAGDDVLHPGVLVAAGPGAAVGDGGLNLAGLGTWKKTIVQLFLNRIYRSCLFFHREAPARLCSWPRTERRSSSCSSRRPAKAPRPWSGLRKGFVIVSRMLCKRRSSEHSLLLLVWFSKKKKIPKNLLNTMWVQ